MAIPQKKRRAPNFVRGILVPKHAGYLEIPSMNGVYDENPFQDSSAHSPLTGPPPSWLQNDPPPTLASTQSSSQSSVGGGVEALGQAGVDPEVPRMILYSRVLNLILSICMIVASLLSLLTTDNATTGVLACYVVVFSCLLCCFETHMKLISKMIALNFGFMYSAKSRCVFMVFVGTILFSFSLFGKIVGCLMLGNAGFNVFVLFKYKGYEEAQRVAAQAEIQDFLSSHSPAFRDQFNLVKAGSAFVWQNPGVVSAIASTATAPTSRGGVGSANV